MSNGGLEDSWIAATSRSATCAKWNNVKHLWETALNFFTREA
jgi:hypothetical protein